MPERNPPVVGTSMYDHDVGIVETCASGDRFVGKAEDKAALHEQFDADICEMEAAGIIKTANRNHVPCLSIKMVSDSLHGGAEEFEAALDETSDKCLAVLDEIMKVL